MASQKGESEDASKSDLGKKLTTIDAPKDNNDKQKKTNEDVGGGVVEEGKEEFTLMGKLQIDTGGNDLDGTENKSEEGKELKSVLAEAGKKKKKVVTDAERKKHLEEIGKGREGKHLEEVGKGREGKHLEEMGKGREGKEEIGKELWKGKKGEEGARERRQLSPHTINLIPENRKLPGEDLRKVHFEKDGEGKFYKSKSKSSSTLLRGGSRKGWSGGGTVSGDDDYRSNQENDQRAGERMQGRAKVPCMRKRSYSFSEGHVKNITIPASKRWKAGRQGGGRGRALGSKNVLPSKFLLGGNIHDPLNLNSLNDEKIARVINAVTPESSPLPTPKHRKEEYKIEVLIPPNISDPLNLNAEDDSDYEAKLLTSPLLKKKKVRHRKRPRKAVPNVDVSSLPGPKPELDEITAADGDVSETDEEGSATAAKVSRLDSLDKSSEFDEEVSFESSENEQVRDVEQASNKKEDEVEATPLVVDLLNRSDDPIPVKQSEPCRAKSPVVEETSAVEIQPEPEKEPTKRPEKVRRNKDKKKKPQTPNFRAKDSRFEYGNYNQYYGYRNPGLQTDIRLQFLKDEWFRDRDVLDIGCNIGHVTIRVARDHAPSKIVGLDIDKSLISVARKNIKYYMNQEPDNATKFPRSMAVLYGPLNPGGISPNSGEAARKFPYNISFVCANYVVDGEELVDTAQPEFDTIMCLSTTKWIHLNYGDDGLKRVFRRIYAQLRPGGTFILEAQSFSSYKKKKKLTERIFNNFKNIKLRPENFTDFLLHDVGFTRSDVVAVPSHSSRGFQRPLQIFSKMPPSSSVSASTTPYSFGISPHCYNPNFTPFYGKFTPGYTPKFSCTPGTPAAEADTAKAKPQDGDPGQDREGFAYPGPTPVYSGPTPGGYSANSTPSGMTPGYAGNTPGYPGKSPFYTGPSSASSTPGNAVSSPRYEATGDTPRDQSPVYGAPVGTPHSSPAYEGPSYTPSYTPGHNPASSGHVSQENTPSYSGHASQENTPSYSGQASQENTPFYSGHASQENTPFYSGNASQPVSQGNTPTYSGPTYSPGQSSVFSPGNATPAPGYSPSTPVYSPSHVLGPGYSPSGPGYSPSGGTGYSPSSTVATAGYSPSSAGPSTGYSPSSTVPAGYSPSSAGATGYSPTDYSPGGAAGYSPGAVYSPSSTAPAGYSPSSAKGYSPSSGGVTFSPTSANTPGYSPNTGPSYSPGPTYSPGNATPAPGSTGYSPFREPGYSPSLQGAEVTGNTTPHPGPGDSPIKSPGPRYSWAGAGGAAGSGSNTPQGGGDTPQGGTTPQGGGDTPQGGTTPQGGGGDTPQGGTTPQGGGDTPQGGTTPQGGGNTPQGGTTPQGGGDTPQGGTTPQGGGDTPQDGGDTPQGGTTPGSGNDTPQGGNTPKGTGDTSETAIKTPEADGNAPKVGSDATENASDRPEDKVSEVGSNAPEVSNTTPQVEDKTAEASSNQPEASSIVVEPISKESETGINASIKTHTITPEPESKSPEPEPNGNIPESGGKTLEPCGTSDPGDREPKICNTPDSKSIKTGDIITEARDTASEASDNAVKISEPDIISLDSCENPNKVPQNEDKSEMNKTSENDKKVDADVNETEKSSTLMQTEKSSAVADNKKANITKPESDKSPQRETKKPRDENCPSTRSKTSSDPTLQNNEN